MNSVESIIDQVGDSFTSFLGAGTFSEMSTGKKVLVGVAVAAVVVVLVFIAYKLFFSSGFNRRVTGPAGCCGKSQNVRNQVVEAVLSDQDMAESNAEYAMIGTPKISTAYEGLAYDNLNLCQGFSSPSAKPDSHSESPMVDHFTGTSGMVTMQVPTKPYQRPALGEADFINMAYTA
jgi:hypothetical protein